jgi:hypothetical protein
MNKTIGNITFVLAISFCAVITMTRAEASEITGNLSTGIGGTADNILTGNVVTPSLSSSGGGSTNSGGGGGISGGGGTTIIKPQVAGAATEDFSQMTHEEKLQKIAEIRLLLIELIKQLIVELQKQLLAIK